MRHNLTRKSGEIAFKRLTPGKAIRAHCIDCVGGASAVNDCRGDELYDGPCLFFSYRIGGSGRPSVKLIRRFCRSCMGGDCKLVRECPRAACPFWRSRMGSNPAMADRRVRI